MDEWIGVKDAAEILEVSTSTVLRSVKTDALADEHWGTGNWRRKPLTSRREIQVRRSRAVRLAADAMVPLDDGLDDGGPASQ